MKNLKFYLTVLLVFMVSTIIVHANTIKETTSNDEFSTIERNSTIIGVTKFTAGEVITGLKAATAGSNDAIVYVDNNDTTTDYKRPKIYIYYGPVGGWYEINEKNESTYISDPKELDSLNIYYVNNNIKKLVYETNDVDVTSLIDSEISYENGKLYVPATMKNVTYKKNNGDNVELIVDTDKTNLVNKSSLFTSVIKSKYTEDGVNGIYYHDGLTGTYKELEAGDYSYRYSGANPDNYVCFGSNAENCSTDNLYRIIGVFGDNVKLVKYDFATKNLLGGYNKGAYCDDSTEIDNYFKYFVEGMDNYKGTLSRNEIGFYYYNKQDRFNMSDDIINTWARSDFNLLNLNSGRTYNNNTTNVEYGFLYTIDNLNDNIKWSNYIVDYKWKIGGMSSDKLSDLNAKELYIKEMFNTDLEEDTEIEKEWIGKVGLSYISDYKYSVSPNIEQTGIPSWEYQEKNNEYGWMYMGLSERTMTRDTNSKTSNKYNINSITDKGLMGSTAVISPMPVRPAFYLKSGVLYVSGDGSQGNPYRIIY